jgi:hypothetical protein
MDESSDARSTDKTPRIVADGEKVAVISCSGTEIREVQLSWKNIRRVIAYKNDCFSIDQIRLEFFGKDELSLLVTEDMKDWGYLMEVLPRVLPGFPAEAQWFPMIAQPPFATNLTVLYEITIRD